MPASTSLTRVRALSALVCATSVLVAGCGGGGGGGGDAAPAPAPTPAPSPGEFPYSSAAPTGSCAASGQNAWLQSYMKDNYFWYASAPDPAPGSGSVDSYLRSRLYTGTDPAFPAADRWSFYETTESFNRFYGAGQTLGYGVSVAGSEVSGQPNQPLYVRYVAPGSPAATAGVVRGDEVVSINGHTAAEYITVGDFGVLAPANSGDQVTLVLRSGGSDRTVSLTSAVYALTPVAGTRVTTTPGGRKLGYVFINNMIQPADDAIKAAFAELKAGGAQDVVIDLRYNGGGLVSTASVVGSLVAGDPVGTQTPPVPFAKLLYNDRKSNQNLIYNFGSLDAGLGLQRVYVLAGARTCSASEQVINGLRGAGINVISIGSTTCGKPVGSRPEPGRCGVGSSELSGLTFNVINFESTNAQNQGRYFDGFQATCQVAENFSKPIGAADDPLLVAAMNHVDTGACPAGTSRSEQPQSTSAPAAGRLLVDGDTQGGKPWR